MWWAIGSSKIAPIAAIGSLHGSGANWAPLETPLVAVGSDGGIAGIS